MPAHRRLLASLARMALLALVAMATFACARRSGSQREADAPERDAPEAARDHDASSRDRERARGDATAGRVLLFRGGRVLTASGVVYERGDVLVRGGRIAAVGSKLQAPEGALVIDVSGKTITPGIIDTHSHLGVYAAPGFSAHSDGNEMVAPATPQARAGDGYWPQDPQIERARAGGVTTMQILPGSANLIGGRSVTVKTYRRARSVDEARFVGAPGGVKMACGENPKRVYGEKGGPATRMGNMAHMRAAFQKALEYQRSWQRYRAKLVRWRAKQARGGKNGASASNGDDDDGEDGKGKDKDDPPDPPARDDGLETLAAVLRGDLLVHNHCYRADEMVLMMDLAESYGFRIRSFHHAVEAYKIADRLARHGAAASVWADWWGFKAESFDGIRENAAFVSAAGARAIIHSDSSVGIQRLNQEAAKAMHAGRRAGVGVSEDEALRWITANPAWALGVEDRVGTLETGMQADIVVWDRSPFSVYARAERVYIEGDLVFERGRTDPDTGSDFELGLRDAPLPKEGT